MTVKVLNVNLKLINGCYPVALETDDGNTATLIPHSTVSDLRAEYEKMHLQPTRLDMKAIVGLVATFEDGIKANDPELLKAITELDPPQKQEVKSTKSVSATGRDTVALKVSKLLASNEQACKAIQQWMDIGIQRKTLPATIPFLLQQTFTKEIRSEMPVPGSIKPNNYKGNVLFDRADSNPGTESWYVGAVEDFPGYWEKIGIPLRKLADLKKDESASNEYTTLGKQKQEDLTKLLQQRKKDLIAAFRDGIELLNIIDDVEARIPGMKVYFRANNGDIEPTTMPMRIYYEDPSKAKGEEGHLKEKFMSVGALRRVELDKVLEADDKFAEFKPVRAVPEEGDESIAGIKSATDLEKVIGWIAVNEKNSQLFTDFNRRLFAPPSESDPLLRLLGDAKATLEALLNNPKLRSRLNAMYEREGEEVDQRIKDKKVA